MVIYPPHPIEFNQKSVFLAGSIDMGNAEDWQAAIITQFENEPVTFLNPRRPDWDKDWSQEIENPQFKAQVEWDLEGLEKADLIAMYLAPTSKAPVSLLELGLFAQSKRIVVCCSEGFWRKGNVDIVCQRYGVPQVPTFESLIQLIGTILEDK